MRTLSVIALAAIAVAARPAAAQTATPEQEVRQVIDRMFNGMRAGDSTAVRSVFHPTARLQTTGTRQGAPMIVTDSIDAFVRLVGTPHDVVYDERISNVEIRVDDNLATAWMSYSFYAGDRFSHCGVNAFQLFRSPEGWKVIQVTDTRRRECPAPAPAAND